MKPWILKADSAQVPESRPKGLELPDLTPSESKKHTERDRETGRYKHTWGVIGHFTPGFHEVAECQACGRIWVYGDGTDHFYRDYQTALRKGGLGDARSWERE